MANININIRMDSDLKQQFEAFCNDVGMTMTTAFTVFAKKAVREYRIPFEIGAEVPNAETKKAIEDARKGKCHITPDWLLIYEVADEELILYLTRTGSHSDLF